MRLRKSLTTWPRAASDDKTAAAAARVRAIVRLSLDARCRWQPREEKLRYVCCALHHDVSRSVQPLAPPALARAAASGVTEAMPRNTVGST